MHRRKAVSSKGSLFWLVFLLLAYLSVIRIIELLPSPEPEAQPALAQRGEEEALSVEKEMLPACEAETSVVSKGLDLRGKEPRILIYHTHTTEAYTATPASPYVKTSSFRTADASKSVIAVG